MKVLPPKLDSPVSVASHGLVFTLHPEMPKAWFRGMVDATLDEYEGCPFASIGGVGVRSMRIPDYIPDADKSMWLGGYVAGCYEIYGPKWQSYAFYT